MRDLFSHNAAKKCPCWCLRGLQWEVTFLIPPQHFCLRPSEIGFETCRAVCKLSLCWFRVEILERFSFCLLLIESDLSQTLTLNIAAAPVIRLLPSEAVLDGRMKRGQCPDFRQLYLLYVLSLPKNSRKYSLIATESRIQKNVVFLFLFCTIIYRNFLISYYHFPENTLYWKAFFLVVF